MLKYVCLDAAVCVCNALQYTSPLLTYLGPKITQLSQSSGMILSDVRATGFRPRGVVSYSRAPTGLLSRLRQKEKLKSRLGEAVFCVFAVVGIARFLGYVNRRGFVRDDFTVRPPPPPPPPAVPVPVFGIVAGNHLLLNIYHVECINV